MDVAILAIGDEVVQGKTINTNASYLAKTLESINMRVIKHMACLDDRSSIIDSLGVLYQSANVVITIGGLGPTIDDLSKEAVAEFFDKSLVIYPQVVDKIHSYFTRQGLSMPESNMKQAYFIEGSKILNNSNGTAPGMIYESGGKIVVVLPGPPKELIPMFEKEALPYLKSIRKTFHVSQKFRLMNIGESHVDELLSTFYDKYSCLKIAPYASVGQIDYIISTNNKDDENLFNEACLEFQKVLEKFIIGDWTQLINEKIVHELIERGLSIATAESLTGGMMASMIVDVPGSSAIFNEGFITYSNESKSRQLTIDPSIIQEKGAVSEEVARAMAEGVASVTGARIGLSTTGIAGPGGATPSKPVGLVYMGISMDGYTKVYRYIFGGDREKVRRRTCMTLLYHLYKDFLQYKR